MTTNNPSTNVFSTTCLTAHVHAIHTDPESYKSQLRFLVSSGTFSAIPTSIRSSILVALHMTSQHKILSSVMTHCEVTEIVKALTLIDRHRFSRQLGRKIQLIENSHPHLISLPDEEQDETYPSPTTDKKRKRRRKIDVYRRKLRGVQGEMQATQKPCADDSICTDAHENKAVQEIMSSAPGVSGALARKVRQWAKTLSSDKLEFVMLTMPDKSAWKTLADLVHFNPAKDFAVPYFLADVYGDAIPATSFVAHARALVDHMKEGNDDHYDNDTRFFALAEEFPQVYLAYSFLRMHPVLMERPAIVETLASNVPIDTVIWYFEEFYKASRNCKDILYSRLTIQTDDVSGNKSAKTTAYGKLMERILTFRRMNLHELANAILPLAASRLEELQAYWKEKLHGRKVAVLGDASSSMQQAIESATIFASLVSVCFDAQLAFFNGGLVPSPHPKPRNVNDALDVCTKIRASGCTSPATAFYKAFLATRKWVDELVIVTDEEENTPYGATQYGMVKPRDSGCFADQVVTYKKDVNPNLKLLVVCVGSGFPPFRQSLDARNIEYSVVTIDGSRPDLAKFDALLGQLAMVSTGTGEEGLEKDSAQNKEEGDDFVLL